MESKLPKSLLFLFFFLLTGRVHAQSPLVVVVHPELKMEDVSFAELRRIMRLDQQYWRGGESISLMLPGPAAPERAPVLERVFQMSEQAFRQYWIAVAYRAQALSLPRPYSDCSVAVRVVSAVKHAMAIVDASCVGDGQVRVLRVDGHVPGEKGYRL